MNNLQINIVGVGGQGTISIGRLLLQTGLIQEYNIRGNETHGMSQRGGSVNFQVRVGQFKGVLIPNSGADIILATEPMEAVRWINSLKPDGIVISDKHAVIPAIVNVTKQKYPKLEKLIDYVRMKTNNIILIPAMKIARSYNNDKAANLVLLGALLQVTPLFDPNILRSLIKEKWPRMAESNTICFDAGIRYVQTNYPDYVKNRSKLIQDNPV